MKSRYLFSLFGLIVALSVMICFARNTNNAEQQVPKQYKANNKTIANQDKVDLILPSYRENELLVTHKGYTLVYNKKYNTPKWVAWTLTAEKTYGQIPRASKFFADPKLPKANRVDWYEYKESGYDRGHMCPSGDNKWDQVAMNECFYMSNICPQNKILNDGSWKYLENSCRDWARREGCIYIVCGPVYKRVEHETIGMQHSIAVPEGFFKVVLTLRKGHEKAVGFYYNNDASNQPMKKAVMTVDDVEKMTGIDFYPSLDDELEDRLESALSML